PVRPEEGIAALPCAFNAPALDCCLCGQLKLQGAARSIEPESRFLDSGGCHLMRNRFPRNCRIQLGSLENVVLLTGDRKFESISLQQRVISEPRGNGMPNLRARGMRPWRG